MMMDRQGIFPFGQPILRVVQCDRTPKKVFVLGVYASAVHARWVDPKGRSVVSALAVASEPTIFWRGDDVESILGRIAVPEDVGRLEPAPANLNGPSGIAMDELFLEPLGLSRHEAWLSDLVPFSCMNPKQATALDREYTPFVKRGLLPAPVWQEVPKVLASAARVDELEAEFTESGAPVIVTLGDQPLRWFTRHFGSNANLSSYGTDESSYGRLHSFDVRGREVSVLPLVHPRQAAGLGPHSSKWRQLHSKWVAETAPSLLDRELQDSDPA